MHHQLERFTSDGLEVPATQTLVLRKRLNRVDVHWHDFYELVFILGGTAQHVVNGLSHEIRPGSAFLLTPADFHEIVTPPDGVLDCYNVVIEPAALDGQLQDLMPRSADQSVWMVDSFEEARADFHRLWEESGEERPGRVALMEAVLRCIMVQLSRRCLATGARKDDHERVISADSGVARAVRFLDHHFREPLTLAGVAAEAHLSPNYFSERFRELTGTSFQAYLQQRRLRFARSLLASTDLGITEVCHAAGFNSLSHFGRAYRKRYGHAPSAFREGHDSDKASNLTLVQSPG